MIICKTGRHWHSWRALRSYQFAKLGGTAVFYAPNDNTHARNRVARPFFARSIVMFVRKTGWHGRFERVQWHHPCAKQGGTTVLCPRCRLFCPQNWVARPFCTRAMASSMRETGWHDRFLSSQFSFLFAKHSGTAVCCRRSCQFCSQNWVARPFCTRAMASPMRETGWHDGFVPALSPFLPAKLGGTAVLYARNGIPHARSRVAGPYLVCAEVALMRETRWYRLFSRALRSFPGAKQGGRAAFDASNDNVRTRNWVAQPFFTRPMTTLMRETGWHDRFLHAQLSFLFAKLGGTAVFYARNGITHARNRVVRPFFACAQL